ncbi:MAG: 3',5'-cyclic-nucleotide phosphodiesterase [bacterium]|nr:3',5'-cyclic-nucleotide phosphodiesterase [bacterium]
MKLKLFPSSFETDGSASPRQHLTCFLVNGSVAVDAGSLAMAVTAAERSAIRDIVLTHAHLDHIAGLPLFIDDQFSELTEAVRIHATSEVIEILERDVFNWSVYPRFSELENSHGKVMEYRPFVQGGSFRVNDLLFESIEVNHKVPCSGFIVSDDSSSIAITGDTADMDSFWTALSRRKISALLIECAFPNELSELAEMSCHLTPNTLAAELEKFKDAECEVYIINIKPSYRESVLRQIKVLNSPRIRDLQVGKTYEWTGESLGQVS